MANKEIKKIMSGKDDFDSKSHLLSEKSSFTVQEAYKTLRTNVMFSLPGTGCKCIGITSAERGEGQSSIAINLAIAFAQLKSRVLVIDCDMRLPTIAKKLGIAQAPGLSNLLAGQTEAEEKLIKRVPEHRIDVLPAGDIPPDPTVLLESKQMTKLVELLREHYDYIIFDFPPVHVVTDAVIMSKIIDGYFLVVRHNYSEFGNIDDIIKTMKFAEAKILGFIYNGKAQSASYSGNGRYYKKNRSYGK